MSAVTALLEITGHDFGKEEQRPRWWLYNERSRRGWYSDTPLKTDDRGDALKLPPTTLDNISPTEAKYSHFDRTAAAVLDGLLADNCNDLLCPSTRMSLQYPALFRLCLW